MTSKKQPVAKVTTAKTPAAKVAKPAAEAKKVTTAKVTTAKKPVSARKQTVAADRKGAARTVSHEQIAKLAYQYSLKNQAASPEENWFKAEAKLLK